MLTTDAASLLLIHTSTTEGLERISDCMIWLTFPLSLLPLTDWTFLDMESVRYDLYRALVSTFGLGLSSHWCCARCLYDNVSYIMLPITPGFFIAIGYENPAS